MATLQDRLHELFPDARGVQSEIARICGVAPPSVNAWFNNPSKAKTLNLKYAELICQRYAPHIRPHWLSDGSGPKMAASAALQDGRIAPSAPDMQNIEPGPELRGKVPLISWVQAGKWQTAAPTGEAEAWMDCPVHHSPGTYALRVRGDSMTAPHGNSRTYPEGSIIFVDPERRSPANGDRIIALLLESDEVTFKVYKNEDGRQWLQPLNPSHEPIREPFQVLGTVLGKWEDG